MTAKILQITPKVGIEFCASRPDFSPTSCGISCITQEVSIFLFLKTRFLSFTPEQTVHKPDTKLRNKTYLSIVAVSNWVINETIFQNSVYFLFFNQPAEQIDLKFATRRKVGWTNCRVKIRDKRKLHRQTNARKQNQVVTVLLMLKLTFVLISLRLNLYYKGNCETEKPGWTPTPVKTDCINPFESSQLHMMNDA